MSANSNHQVISLINRKNDSGTYTPFYLSPEQRFVKPLQKSNNNNLEEQFLIGVDNMVTSWTENNVGREVVEFRSTEEDTDINYYILDKYDYTNTLQDINVSVQGTSLVFDTGLCNVEIVGNALVDNQGNNFMVYDSSTNSLDIAVESIFLKEYLKYKQSDGTLLNVSSKIQSKRYVNDPLNKVTIKSTITNLL